MIAAKRTDDEITPANRSPHPRACSSSSPPLCGHDQPIRVRFTDSRSQIFRFGHEGYLVLNFYVCAVPPPPAVSTWLSPAKSAQASPRILCFVQRRWALGLESGSLLAQTLGFRGQRLYIAGFVWRHRNARRVYKPKRAEILRSNPYIPRARLCRTRTSSEGFDSVREHRFLGSAAREIVCRRVTFLASCPDEQKVAGSRGTRLLLILSKLNRPRCSASLRSGSQHQHSSRRAT